MTKNTTGNTPGEMTTTLPPESEKPKKEKVDMMERVVTMLGNLGNSIDAMSKRVTSLEGKTPVAPDQFTPQVDTTLPQAYQDIIRIVRMVLGNRIHVEVTTVPGDMQPLLNITVPENFLTPHQKSVLTTQRVDEIRDANGKIIDRKTVTILLPDVHSRVLPGQGTMQEAEKFAKKVADFIRTAYDKSKLPVPDFFI